MRIRLLLAGLVDLPTVAAEMVTGTFRPGHGQIGELIPESEPEPIGFTPGHLFWSEDRRAWVPGGSPRRSETLQAMKGVTHVVSYTLTGRVRPVYHIEVEGSHGYRVGEGGLLVHNMSAGPIPAPSGATDCCPEVRRATATEFELVNPSKQSNFLIGELVSGGQLSFLIENLPRTPPHTGCPGQWMFRQMMMHFGTSVTAIQGSWVGASSENLITINRLTAGGAMTIEEAAKQTWTGMRAGGYGYTRVQVVGTAAGTPGHYTSVHVRFTK